MLMNNEEIEVRLNHPDNLINRMNSLRGITSNTNNDINTSNTNNDINTSNNNKNAMGIFGVGESKGEAVIPALPPTVDDLVEDVENKLKSSKAYGLALDTLVDSVSALNKRLVEVEKPERLSRIAVDMHKIVNDINEGKNSRRMGDGGNVIVYKPLIVNESAFQVVHANE